MTWDQRLRDAFEETGWSKAEFARRADLSYDNINKYLAGAVKQPRGDALEKLAAALGLSSIYLEKGADPDNQTTEVAVMGYVGAGAEVEPDFEQIPPEGMEQVTVPFYLPGEMIAFKVRGTSMLPVFKDGTIIVVYREQQRATDSFLGEEAIVRTHDGRRYVKTIMRGPRGFTLSSWNADPIENIQIVWVGEIFAVIPSSALRRVGRQGGLQGQLSLKTA